jgi:hypothetical protein
MLSLDGSMTVLVGSTVVLCIDGDIRVLEHQHQPSIGVEEDSMTFPTENRDLNFLVWGENGCSHCMLTAFLWVESGGTASLCPSESHKNTSPFV